MRNCGERRAKARPVCVALAVATVPFGVSAQDAPTAMSLCDADSFDAPCTIAVTGRPEASDPITVVVIDRSAIDASGATHVADALASVPGVALSRNGSVGGFTGVMIRGAETAHTAVVIDGVRAPDPSTPAGGYDFAALAAGNVQRIEVLRGSNSLAWGSDAVGGVVVVDHALPDSSGFDASASARGGSHGTAEGSVHLATRSEAWAAAFGGTLFRTNGISAAAAGQEADGARLVQLTSFVRVGRSDGLRLEVQGSHTRARSELDGYPPPTYTLGDIDEWQRFRETRAAVRVMGAHRVGAWSADHALEVSHAASLRAQFSDAATDTPSYRARGKTQRVRWTTQWSAPSNAVRFLTGLEAERQSMTAASAWSQDAGRASTQSAFVLGDAHVTSTLTLDGGLRVDRHSRAGTVVTAAAGAALNLSDNVRMSVHYRGGFKAPTLFQTDPSAFAYGNPDLKPERSDSAEVALRWSRSETSATVTLFTRTTRNLIDFVGCTPTGPAICAEGTRPFGTYDNVRRARAQGADMFVSHRWSPTVLTEVGSAYLDTRDRSGAAKLYAGNPLPRRPRWSGSAAVTVGRDDTPSVRFAVSYAGARYDDRAALVRLAPSTALDIVGRWPVTNQIALSFSATNFLKSATPTAAGYNAEPQQFLLGLRWRL